MSARARPSTRTPPLTTPFASMSTATWPSSTVSVGFSGSRLAAYRTPWNVPCRQPMVPVTLTNSPGTAGELISSFGLTLKSQAPPSTKTSGATGGRPPIVEQSANQVPAALAVTRRRTSASSLIALLSGQFFLTLATPPGLIWTSFFENCELLYGRPRQISLGVTSQSQ